MRIKFADGLGTSRREDGGLLRPREFRQPWERKWLRQASDDGHEAGGRETPRIELVAAARVHVTSLGLTPHYYLPFTPLPKYHRRYLATLEPIGRIMLHMEAAARSARPLAIGRLRTDPQSVWIGRHETLGSHKNTFVCKLPENIKCSLTGCMLPLVVKLFRSLQYSRVLDEDESK